MNIYASKGHKVICTSLEHGYEYDQEKARKYLRIGGRYTIEKTEIHNFNTDVFLQEFPDVFFSSVFFEDLDKFESENRYHSVPDLDKFYKANEDLISEPNNINPVFERFFEKNKITTENNSNKYTKFNTDKKHIKLDDRQRKITELVSKFKNGEELYKRNPVFHQVIQMLLEGCDEYEVIEQIILANYRTQKAFEDYIVRDYNKEEYDKYLYNNMRKIHQKPKDEE